jgi:hypothetical protein
VQYGIHINNRISNSKKWYKEEPQDTSLTDTTTPHLLVICSISLNGHL